MKLSKISLLSCYVTTERPAVRDPHCFIPISNYKFLLWHHPWDHGVTKFESTLNEDGYMLI